MDGNQQFFCFACKYKNLSRHYLTRKEREKTGYEAVIFTLWRWWHLWAKNRLLIEYCEQICDQDWYKTLDFSSTQQTRWLAKMIIPSESVRWIECCMNLPRRIFKFPHLSCVTKYVINLSLQLIDPKSKKNPSESEVNSLLLERVI